MAPTRIHVTCLGQLREQDMSEMVDRLARIINPAAFEDCVPGHREGECEDCDESREEVKDRARQVLEALRVPTEAMSRKGFAANTFTNLIQCCASPTRLARVTLPAEPVWQAMIDEALADSSAELSSTKCGE